MARVTSHIVVVIPILPHSIGATYGSLVEIFYYFTKLWLLFGFRFLLLLLAVLYNITFLHRASANDIRLSSSFRIFQTSSHFIEDDGDALNVTTL